MTTAEVMSLSATVASLVLAVVAIALSIIFYKMSTELSESTQEAAKGIGASVERLEKLFDKLYADTFSMMRDTVSDMRRHIWPDESAGAEDLSVEADRRTDEKLGELREDMKIELSDVLSRQMAADERVRSLMDVVDRAMVQSRQVETNVRRETLRSRLLQILRSHREITASDVIGEVGASVARVRRELDRMMDEDLVHFDRDFRPETVIHVSPRVRHGEVPDDM